MHLIPRSFRNLTSALFTILALAVVAQAQDAANQRYSEIKIKNFGQMDERFFRGAQPQERDYKDLAALGIKTVIDLTAEPKPYEREAVESLGMKYVNIPMLDKKYPTEAATKTFLKIAADPATGKFFVHCAGGRHRTGAMGAVYRYQFYDWNFEQVYAEMKKYDFYTSWGHGPFKDFVLDYYEKMRTAKTSGSAAGQSGSVRAQ
ncbi:MAG TPA: tyrosine-protein phosphatase [Pyrinomonadaceae bacterium]|jgi:protein tyrosine/serine phosphatase|nr:tyrosine-protein phosphatase [Pyrinomonadaceae bacterium]